MTVRDLLADFDADALGESMMDFVRQAYPICRSITGDGVRQTLDLMGEIVPLEVHEVPSGTRVLDWTVPDEWNVRAAWIKGPDGRKVVDFAEHNLHLLNYSEPVHAILDRAELDSHLYSLPDQPELVPYRTSYFQRRWGFCLAHELRESLPDGDYEVLVDATLEPGSLTYAEALLPGESEQEILLSAHICHPSLCNDNLSALAVVSHLGKLLGSSRRRFSYRLLFAPGTIGAITWLARNSESVGRIRHGLVAANLGDPGGFHYKRSRRGTASIDRAVERVLGRMNLPLEVTDFVPFGYDERQFGSPGFALDVGSLTRTPWGQYPEYHTSADNVELVSGDRLAESLRVYLEITAHLEDARYFRNCQPFGEPQLGSRGLYRTLGGDEGGRERELALLWVLNQSDGLHSLLDIADRSGLALRHIEEAAHTLHEAGLLEKE